MSIFCAIGIHGPLLGHNEPTGPRNSRIRPGVRCCRLCGAVWLGYEIELRHRRALGWHKADKEHAAEIMAANQDN